MERFVHEGQTMETDDRTWLAEYRRGSVEALAMLVERYRKPLFGFILRMTEGRADADDIFQEVWVRAIRNMNSYRDKSFVSWLFRIAHNLVIDRVRKRRPMETLMPRTDDEAENPMETRLADPAPGPDSEVAERELGARILRAVEQLPLEQKEVFLLRTQAGLSFKDISKIQQTSINTALARMQYALNKLRHLLQDDYAALKGAAT
jgi:RNA polymerase sigma-70 factor (ECF subfamily)